MKHHGTLAQRGIDAMCDMHHTEEGRFGRLFPSLSPLYSNAQLLKELGNPKGPMDAKGEVKEAKSIPLGMVFLGQFIDHDITLDTTSSLDRVNDENATRNFRTPTLDLDCIYGNGPEASPHLYKNGLYLLTGADGTGFTSQKKEHRAHDLTRNSQGTAIIGDPRNDENRIVSQLQLAFIRFHNVVVEEVIKHIGREEKRNLSKQEIERRSSEIFEEAQRWTRWHYQWIVVHEFLPAMVGKDMVHDILSNGRKWYRPKRRPFIPIEFSAAAYRFGHSLASENVRTKHDSEEVGLFSTNLGRGFSPVNNDIQIIQWDQFFNFHNGRQHQCANRVDTKLPSMLLALPFIKHGERSLAVRNLLRGQSFLLPSGEAVALHMNIDEQTRERVNQHIRKLCAGIELNCTPLWFYILAEADCTGKRVDGDDKPGEGLGPVGGRIVAETIIGLLELDGTSFLGANRGWIPQLGKDSSFTIADLVRLTQADATPCA